MIGKKEKLFLIKIAYWLGIGADALWAVVLPFPSLFGILTGIPNWLKLRYYSCPWLQAIYLQAR